MITNGSSHVENMLMLDGLNSRPENASKYPGSMFANFFMLSKDFVVFMLVLLIWAVTVKKTWFKDQFYHP